MKIRRKRTGATSSLDVQPSNLDGQPGWSYRSEVVSEFFPATHYERVPEGRWIPIYVYVRDNEQIARIIGNVYEKQVFAYTEELQWSTRDEND